MLRIQDIAEQWRNIALMTLDTAKTLRDASDHRSCVSRAYYAAYQAATSICILHGDAPHFPPNWNNPSHEQLPDLIANNGELSVSTRRVVRRETADYRVGRTVNAETVRAALILTSVLFERLEITHDNH